MPVEFLTVADRRIAFQRQIGDHQRPGVLFLGGYASDMQGSKASFLAQRTAQHDLSFVRFDYGGCGQSVNINPLGPPSAFRDQTIGAWLADTRAVFDALTDGPQIIVGSSMGAWLGMLLVRMVPDRVRAFIGVAPAPDFTERLVWNRLSTVQREALHREGEIVDPEAPRDHRVPITRKLIEEARHHLVLDAPLRLACPVRFLQGTQDKEVPPTYVNDIVRCLAYCDVRVTMLEGGDHRLSTTENLDALWAAITEFLPTL